MVIETAALCLALNIFHESRGESVPGQYAVAQVTMNRAKNNPDRVCKEVFKPHQFSWTGDVQRTGTRWVIPAHMVKPIKREPDAWKKAQIIARVTLEGRMQDFFAQGATYYHAVRVKPYWAEKFTRVRQLGAHVFYRPALVSHR